ncbi:amidohydrolase family protein [Nocardia alni]|uniref:amidohydrolase family protein n=1 Tax=Nocardia alni TaxID=2815723 RepID=UPI001C215159|nr:amidohydrolase family protein [Nocardia alni]
MDIVDAQLHLGRRMIEPTLEAMDALGITSVLLDEFWGVYRDTGPTHFEPGHLLENGAWRVSWPTAEEAAILHPGRFSYLVRIDRRDPQLESLMRFVGTSPHARAFRLQPVWTLDEVEAFATGAYTQLLEIAQDVGLPVFLFIPGYVELLEPYARQFPGLTFVVDHCGMGFPGIPAGRPQEEARAAQSTGYFDRVLRLADLPNIALKWSHAQNYFGATTYPYPEIRPYLRRAIEAFGADRLLWASDKSVMFGHTWADLLYSVSDDPELSQQERDLILGGSARRILQWPLPSEESLPASEPTAIV